MRKSRTVKAAGKLALIGVIGLVIVVAAQQPSDVFQQKIAPIFEQNCVLCHGAKIQRSGLDLRTEQATLKGGGRGATVVPGKPEESLLYKLITHKEEPAMPMGGKLSDAEIAAIAEWINGLKPSAAPVADTIPTRNAGYSITAKDRQWWSFIKPARPAVPTVKKRRWVRNEIDAFILSKLEANGLQPSAPADARTLIRRVYYDLIGLPPSPEEVEAFVKNPSNAAYEKIVDKLLASEHYGERWGRHWLDLARYADSGGYEFDYDRPHAWHYRDWVIKAFNADLPYDQFIRAQLANDQINPGTPEALIPTTFCRNGPTVDNVTNEETRSDEMDDMVSTTSTVFLGLTMGCARCHDHKYDPLPTKDYYRMVAIFNSSEKTEKPLVSEAAVAAHKAANEAVNEKLRPFRKQMADIEKPFREKLMNEKIDFHVRLAESSSGFGDKTKEQFREETSKRLYREVNIQPEEIDELMTPEQLKERRALQKQIDDINKTRPQPVNSAMGVTDKKESDKTYLYLRGNWRTKGEEVQPGLPTVLSDGKDLPPTNRRQQLAEFIVSPDNPLTARVAVNRIWKYHFGNGLVKTTSDFGLTGDRPSHPELLDWLAVEFMNAERGTRNAESGKTYPQSPIPNPQSKAWSWKAMHKLMLLSNTYRQASQYNEQAATKDNDNRLLWRMNPRRLEAEALRDTMLVVSNKLNKQMYGPGIYPRIDPDIINTGSRPRWPLDAKDNHDTFRRSIYIFVKRSVLLPMIEVFDCPVTVVSAPNRATSTVSPQALALMNNEFVLEQAKFFSERVTTEAGADVKQQIARAFQIALHRKPSQQEQEWSLNFLKTQTDGYAQRKHERPDAAALRDFCHAVMNLNEFLYVD
jgi:mono/diheme cytochrome c family protein